MHNRKIRSLLLHGIVGTGTQIFNRCESFGNVWTLDHLVHIGFDDFTDPATGW